MKKLLFLLMIMGCSHHSNTSTTNTPQTPPTNVATPEPSNEEKVGLLRKLAKTESLHWNILCVPNNDRTVNHYQGDAFQNGTVDFGNGFYYEDGVRDWWTADGDTPEDAAYALYQAIQGPPTQHIDHRPVIKGNCNYQEVLNSQTEAKTPCKQSSE
jgi:hypothetical protein